MRPGLQPARIVGPARSIIAGGFTTVNGGNPTVVRGNGFSVVRAAEGRWTVTLGQAAMAIDSITFGVATATLTTMALVFEDQNVRTTTSFEIRALGSAALAPAGNWALDDITGSEISFNVVCRDTSASDYGIG